MGAIGTDPGLVKSYYQQVADNLYDPTYIKKIPVAETASEPYLWVAMLFLVDCSRFGEFLSGLQNNYVKGLKKYHSNMKNPYNMLNQYVIDTK